MGIYSKRKDFKKFIISGIEKNFAIECSINDINGTILVHIKTSVNKPINPIEKNKYHEYHYNATHRYMHGVIYKSFSSPVSDWFSY